MAKSSTIAALILGASIGAALLKFYSMPKEERDAFFDHLKKTSHDLLDNAEDTVEKVEHFMGEVKSKGEKEWIEKLYVLKKMFGELYGSDKRHFL
jgi:predicted RNA-binding protein with EMAP domain